MSTQSVGRFNALPHPDVRSISFFLGWKENVKLAAVCKRWRDHVILSEERRKYIPSLVDILVVPRQVARVNSAPDIISVFGLPGAGKGTFAQGKAKQGYKPYKAFSLGDELRRQVREKTFIGERFKEEILSHKPIPLDVIHDIVADQLQEHAKNGLILDGFPREKSIPFFDELLRVKYPKLSFVVVHIKVTPEVAQKRLDSRLVCESCDKIYNMKLYHALSGLVNLEGHHKSPSLNDPTPGILRQYGPPHDRSNLSPSEAPQNSLNLTERGIPFPDLRCNHCNEKLTPRIDAGAKDRLEGCEAKFAATFTHYKSRLIEIDGNQPLDECLKQFDLNLQMKPLL